MKTINQTYLILLLLFMAVSAYAQKWQWAHSGGSSELNMPDQGFDLAFGEKDTILNLGVFSGQLQLDNNYNLGPSVASFIAKYTPDGRPIASSLIRRFSSGGVVRTLGLRSFSKTDFYVYGDIYGSYYFDTILATGGGGGYVAKFDAYTRCEKIKTGISDGIQAITFDNRGNMYITGPIKNSIAMIDTFRMYNNSITIGGGPSPWAYMAKLDSNGKCIWVKQSYGRMGFGRTAMVNNNLYGIVSIDSCVIFGSETYCPTGSFLMQLDTSGKAKWFSPLKQLSGGSVYSGIGVDKIGNCYVAGNFDGNIGLLKDTIYKSGKGTLEVFLIKYKPDGSVAWHRQIYSDSIVGIRGIHTNDAGYTYIVGIFSGTAVFGNDVIRAKPGTDTVKTAARNMFIARYDADGNYLGVKTVYNAIANNITTDDSGSAIVTGSIHLGTTHFDDIERTSNGGDDYFVAKLSAITGNNNTIKEATLNDKLLIYTNPNSGTFTIEVPASIAANTTAHLQIYNTAGSLIKSETVYISNSTIGVDIGTVQKGLYTVTITGSDAKKFTGKVMVE
ncbi:MAG TPA: T9SS type A sorting domain-containing protein [Chitinophagales bacterium]|nr:T9SS type A sorting domain-containing protein [Chitinophagales bacterium]